MEQNLVLVLLILAVFLISFLIWPRLRTTLKYLFYLRVPILLGTALLFLPYFTFQKAESLLGDLFVHEHVGDLFWVTLLAFLEGCSLMVITQLIYRNAEYALTRELSIFIPASSAFCLSRVGTEPSSLVSSQCQLCLPHGNIQP